MISKKERTIERYENAGALISILNEVFSKFIVESGCLLYSKDTDSLINLKNKLCHFQSALEDNMYNDFPQLGRDYVDVFYGGISGGQNTNVTMRHYLLIVSWLDQIKSIVEQGIKVCKETNITLQSSVRDIDLSERTRNCLQRDGRFVTVHQLIDGYCAEELITVRNLGRKCVSEIEQFLTEHNFI